MRVEPVEIRRRGVGQDVVRSDGRVDISHRDDSIGLGNGQRPQQHRVDDREDGRVGAETDGQRQDGGRRKAAILDEQPDARLQIADKSERQDLPKRRDEGALRLARKWSMFRMREPDDARLGVEQAHRRASSSRGSDAEARSRPLRRSGRRRGGTSYDSSICAASSSTILASRCRGSPSDDRCPRTKALKSAGCLSAICVDDTYVATILQPAGGGSTSFCT